jgi:hypothetical protein
MSRLGNEPGPSTWEASTLEKSNLDSLFAGYSEPLLGLMPAQQQPVLYMAPPSACDDMDSTGCRPNSPCIASRNGAPGSHASPRDSDHVGVTTIEDLTRVISILF